MAVGTDHPGLSTGTIGFGQMRQRKRYSPLALALTVTSHLFVLAAVLWPRSTAPHLETEPQPIVISLLDNSNSKPPGPPDAARATEIDPPQEIHPVPPPEPEAPVIVVAAAPAASNVLSESQLAGAARAGAGGIGGACNMAWLLQQALQHDPMVRKAVLDSNRVGQATLLWNGDWVRSGVQDGKGLSVVRETIMWEVAFAPEACRNERRRGLVLLSLADGGTRFAIGTDNWRWSDLLGLR